MYRSHHEKLVIVDYQICYIGGLDLCFGRYDTIEHKVGDCPPSVWPGKDYYNPRYFSMLVYFAREIISLVSEKAGTRGLLYLLKFQC